MSWTDSQVEVALAALQNDYTPCMLRNKPRPSHIPIEAASDTLRYCLGYAPLTDAEVMYRDLWWSFRLAGVKDPADWIRHLKGNGGGHNTPNQGEE